MADYETTDLTRNSMQKSDSFLSNKLHHNTGSTASPGTEVSSLTTLNTTPIWTHATNKTVSDPIYDFYQNGQLVFLIVLFSLIVIGNVSVLVAISLSKPGRRSRMNFFIKHLAIADLLVGFISVLTDIIWKITLEWLAGDIMCKIVKYLQAVVTFGSTYVLVALSIDRWDAIARPLGFSGSEFRAKILVIIAWGLAALFSVPMLFLSVERTMPMDGTTQCLIGYLSAGWHWQVYITLIAIAVFFVPALMISVCYIYIIYVIWSKSSVLTASSKRSTPKTSKGNGNHAEQECLDKKKSGSSVGTTCSSRGVIPQAKIRTVKMTLVIVLMFILCWSPFFVFDILDVYGYIPKSKNKRAISTFIQSLAPLNSMANPIIYGIFSSRICQNLRRIRGCELLYKKLCCYCLDDTGRRHDYRQTPSQYSSTVMSYAISNTRNSTVPKNEQRLLITPTTDVINISPDFSVKYHRDMTSPDAGPDAASVRSNNSDC